MRVPVFLDRDGVLNENRADYVRKPSQLKMIPGAVEAVSRLKAEGFPVIVVTNQSGIGRGYYERSSVEAIHELMRDVFSAAGTAVDRFYYCPHHPHDRCGCRKPETGMVDLAREQLDLPGTGWMVGDAHSDMELGRRSGLRTILVLTGRGRTQLDRMDSEGLPRPDHITDSLLTASELILSTPWRRA